MPNKRIRGISESFPNPRQEVDIIIIISVGEYLNRVEIDCRAIYSMIDMPST